MATRFRDLLNNYKMSSTPLTLITTGGNTYSGCIITEVYYDYVMIDVRAAPSGTMSVPAVVFVPITGISEIIQ